MVKIRNSDEIVDPLPFKDLLKVMSLERPLLRHQELAIFIFWFLPDM
jgi:hypothetical protein